MLWQAKNWQHEKHKTRACTVWKRHFRPSNTCPSLPKQHEARSRVSRFLWFLEYWANVIIFAYLKDLFRVPFPGLRKIRHWNSASDTPASNVFKQCLQQARFQATCIRHRTKIPYVFMSTLYVLEAVVNKILDFDFRPPEMTKSGVRFSELAGVSWRKKRQPPSSDQLGCQENGKRQSVKAVHQGNSICLDALSLSR